jgi:Mg2+ and Co2+ transporter CorA
MTGDLPGVSSSYWEYFTHLESLIKKDRLNRGHQAKIATVLEELDIIKEQLQEQHNIIIQLKRGPLIERDHERYPAFSGMYNVKLLEKCIDSVSGTEASLSELQRKTQSLEAASVAYIQSNKEQQERAIYVFTIVTIIFLPISTVSSIFGMNVEDVRSMENGQWVFWAVAIPVTAIVIIGSLFGAGVIPFRGKQSVALPRGPRRLSDHSRDTSDDENEVREVRRARHR